MKAEISDHAFWLPSHFLFISNILIHELVESLMMSYIVLHLLYRSVSWCMHHGLVIHLRHGFGQHKWLYYWVSNFFHVLSGRQALKMSRNWNAHGRFSVLILGFNTGGSPLYCVRLLFRLAINKARLCKCVCNATSRKIVSFEIPLQSLSGQEKWGAIIMLS